MSVDWWMDKQLWQVHTMTCWFVLQHESALNTSCREPACQWQDMGSIPGSGRSPGGGNGNPLKYPCLENATDRGAWRAAVQGLRLNKRSRIQKTTHCTSPYPSNVQNRQAQRTERRRVQARGEQKWLLIDKEFLLGWWKCAGIRRWWWLHTLWIC